MKSEEDFADKIIDIYLKFKPTQKNKDIIEKLDPFDWRDLHSKDGEAREVRY